MEQRYWPICRYEDVRDPGSREFALQIGERMINGFVIHWRGRWYAYRNSCPHTGVTLNWLPDQFFDPGLDYIQCSLHGALFQPHDGLCVYGPCLGRPLTSLPVLQQGDSIVLDSAGLRAG